MNTTKVGEPLMHIAIVLEKQSTLVGWSPRCPPSFLTRLRFWNFCLLSQGRPFYLWNKFCISIIPPASQYNLLIHIITYYYILQESNLLRILSPSGSPILLAFACLGAEWHPKFSWSMAHRSHTQPWKPEGKRQSIQYITTNYYVL